MVYESPPNGKRGYTGLNNGYRPPPALSRSIRASRHPTRLPNQILSTTYKADVVRIRG